MTDYLCNLVIPGAAKSGTTSLHEALSQHPDICMSRPKEPQFFSFDDFYMKGASFHNDLFRHCEEPSKYYGESSQCYFAHPWAIERIVRELRKPKIIIMLRHPVDRVISQYQWNFRRGLERDSIGNAVESRGEQTGYEFFEVQSIYRAIGGYLAFSRYSKWVPLWKSAFGEENVLIIKFEDFIRNQNAVTAECFSFLGLSSTDIMQSSENRTSDTYKIVLPSSLRWLAKRVPGAFKKYQLYNKMRIATRASLTPRPEPVSEGTLRHLNERLSEDIRFFEEA